MSDNPFGSPSRVTRLVAELAEAETDVLLVTSLVNVRYLTGYTGSNGLAVIGPDTRVFITDFRYQEQSAAQVDPSFDRRIATLDLVEGVADALPTGSLTLGFEDDVMTVRAHARLRELMPERVALTAAGDPVEKLRAIKEPGEVERIRAATELADAALREVMEQGLTGRTEIEVATALEAAMRRRGAQRPSFDSIIAAGPHGALPHAAPRDVTIGADELVVVDWGAQLDGYCSDCTRTLATGDPGEEAKIAYDLVLEAQLAGLEAVRAGVSGRDADAAARAVIDGAGHGEHFGHGLGHGVGLDIHEAPRLSRRSDSVLQDGNVVTVEPGVYLPGRFGIRIEDLVVVAGSEREILTAVPKELITVG
jgi:Xaa-Pro aminopeptidase